MLRQTDFISGCVFVLLGLFFGLGAIQYRLGTPAHMGAGFLPLALATVLVLLGAAIVAKSLLRQSESIEWGSVLPVAIVVGSVVLFAATLRQAGFAGASFLTVLAASFARPSVGWIQRLVLALFCSVVATIIFIELLGLPIPVWPLFVSG